MTDYTQLARAREDREQAQNQIILDEIKRGEWLRCVFPEPKPK